jgi:hypothetical protein
VCVCSLYQQHQDSSRASYPRIIVQHCTALHTVQPASVDHIILHPIKIYCIGVGFVIEVILPYTTSGDPYIYW